MSNERNVEAVGCDASIMKNVWAIREREYEQKLQQEEERKSKSALPSINKDWANRLAARQGNYKRPERKPRSVEIQEEDNIWKTKKPQPPPPLPRGAPGAGPISRPAVSGRPGVPSRGPSTTNKKMPDKGLMRLQLLMFINQGQPSTMVWGKSWKYNKSLQPPAEVDEARSDWGQCWMFATQQPYSEAGMPWKNGPNLMDPKNLKLWEKLETRVVESQDLDLRLPEDEWHISWKKNDKTSKDKSSVDGENFFKWFSELEHTQQQNEELCTSEWNESWMATKPNEEDGFTAPNDGPVEQDNDKDMSAMLEGWKLANHHGRNNVMMTQVKRSLGPVWVDSWRAAMMVHNNSMNSKTSMKHEYKDEMTTYCDNGHHKESYLYKVSLKSHEKKYKSLYSQLWDEFQALSEWTKSWQVTKNNSKPCEEIAKILKLSQEAVSHFQKVESKGKDHHSTPGNVDPRYEQLKHSVMYHPKREFTQSQLLRLKHMGNVYPTSEWKDSWRTVKHRMRTERRRYRPDPSRPFRAPERGGDRMPAASQWKDSWKYNCQPLHQEPEHWQQGWTTMPQIRVDRAREWNHFAPVELPKNGPTTERGWEQSWRFLRHQRQAGPGQERAQTSQGRPNMHHSDNSWAHRRYVRSNSDWQEAWMISETRFRHDRPSLTQWREAWQWSIFHTERMADQMPRENRLSVLMEIQPQREWISWQRAQAKMSRSFDTKMFRERYPEKQWNSSWKSGPLLSHTASFYGSSGTTGKNMSTTVQQQHTTTNGHGSKWGRCFRIANPMPQLEQPWVQSSPSPSQYTVMWFRGMTTPNKINTKFSNSPANFNQWGSSHRFRQGASSQFNNNMKFKQPVDPMVIIIKHINSRIDLYSKLEKEKQADRTWVGCHLLGKTQPRPKRGAAPAKIPSKEEDDDKFYEEWVESWKFLVKSGNMKRMPVISFKSWNESWKCLIPPYPPTNGIKTR